MSLWEKNRPQDFWRIARVVPDEVWSAAVQKAAPILAIPDHAGGGDIDRILENTLGEGQFGARHWEMSAMKRQYYMLKPLIPRVLSRLLRQIYSGRVKKNFPLGWPIEDRYVRFLWETLRQVLLMADWNEVTFVYFWPKKSGFALVLTHDIETAEGQSYIPRLVELEERIGWRSSFNFIPERYPLDTTLMAWLRKHGFEIGVHGLKHDGKEFFDKHTFSERASKINNYVRQFGAVGFRAPLTHRNPEWMQELEIAYDASFFDTDPFEPIAGGVMTIWPYRLGRFIELPYTLVQDYSLFNLLEEKSPRIWLEKVEFIRKYHGMALINTHPDYLRKPENFQIYADFLYEMSRHQEVWNVLPAEAAAWWKARSEADPNSPGSDFSVASASMADDRLLIEF